MNTRSLRGAARRNKTRRRSKKGKNTEYKSKNIIKKGIAGYGVFAGKGYNKGEIIETCPFIQIGKEHLQEINGKRNPLRDYVFTSHLKKDHELIVFGNGSLFNHSDNPNVKADVVIPLKHFNNIKRHWYKLAFFSPNFAYQKPGAKTRRVHEAT